MERENREHLMEFVKLHKCYDQDIEILSKVSGKMKGGCIYGLVAPNGAGKSTLMKCCVSLCNFTGSILYDGESVGTHLNGKIVYAPDIPLFNKSTLTVSQYLGKIAIMKGLGYSDVLQRANDSLLSSLLDATCSELSTGWKKILQIFIETLADPEVLLLDEPFNGLDHELLSLLIEKIKVLASEGKIILISTHTFADLEDLADSVFALRNGQLISNDHHESIKDFYRAVFPTKKVKLF